VRMAVLNKIRSRKGASITFALLAFLVCAVVSSVLLAAASASTGRYSGLADMDQRYYAVTSAAQLFCDTLDGQSFTIEQTCTVNKKVTTSYIYADSFFKLVGTSTEDGAPPVDYGLRIKAPYDIGKPGERYTGEELQEVTMANGNGMKSNSLLTEAALYYVFGDTSRTTDTVVADTFVSKTFSSSSHTYNVYPTWNLTLEVGDKDCLTVSVEGTMSDGSKPNTNKGDIELEFKNTTSDDDVNAFSMIIVLRAEVKESQVTLPERTVGSGSRFYSDLEYDSWVMTAQDTVNTTVITWRVVEVKKVAA
jgi:hypothetical protein